ncbi:MAG TPA: transposase [Candidatus Acidoferrum sp.]|nr:transposase [Candidatus Acidoferrum sp.]
MGNSQVGEVDQKGAVRLRKAERHQLSLLPHCIDELVALDHRVGTVMAVVDKLDVSGFCAPIRAREGRAGRNATDPHLLVGLWLYGCVRGIGSARELARRCEESLPFRWLCGGVSVNHRLLSDFRTDHADALDALFTQVLVTLVDKKLVRVSRISQDGVRIRVSAGSNSFRREERLELLLTQAREHVLELRKQLESPAQSAAVTARQRAARTRAAASRQQRLEQAIAQLPELKEKQAEAAKRAGKGKCGDQIRARQPRVSTTDAATRVMKMANGGYSPAANVQLAADTGSRAILGVSISNESSDSAGLSEPMREQVEQRTAGKVKQHLVDGGYLRMDDIVEAHDHGVELFVPPKPARNPENRGDELKPKPGDSEAIRAWKQRMDSEQGKKTYHQRAATSETVNAELRTYRGLTPLTVRGLDKIKCVALWCALAYNLTHFSKALLS